MKLPITELLIVYLIILNSKLFVSAIPVMMNETEKSRAIAEKEEEKRNIWKLLKK